MRAASREPIQVRRDCRATVVPDGHQVTLSAGERVYVVQTLGMSITVRSERGRLLRVDATDADALGLHVPGAQAAGAEPTPFRMAGVIEALNSVYDPEIPVSVVELGLIYRCDEQQRSDGTRLISIDMSMTAPGCGMGDILRVDVERVVGAIPGVDDVDVTLVWDPPWSMSRMSEAARLQLGML